MKIRKYLAATFLFAVLSVSNIVNASLIDGATLTMNAGVPECVGGFGIYPTCDWGVTYSSGSYFDMRSNGKEGIESNNGIILGQDQPASGSHTMQPNGSESPGIDNPWSFFANTGMHQTLLGSGGIKILSDDGSGNVLLDFSAWNVTWNAIDSIDMGSGAHSGGTNGIATMTCGNTCEDGDTYSLVYYATVPNGNVSGFGGVQYSLFLEGSVNPVPVPAAVWLFGSGLIGLIGIAKRKKT
ncbi:MAG: VPLPA-CTERM sorting domain-containing protein [Gammaproteobacteria bacterium]|nr:VPLPA-CTERM sorting domain-containing protein [Gammaproteobacteria bacterium]MCK5092868.1 VPLPA-CTERM sorting domain-containing protein [Gammaproteobacteria bacterium]